jgi:hypothetical protein
MQNVRLEKFGYEMNVQIQYCVTIEMHDLIVIMDHLRTDQILIIQGIYNSGHVLDER